MGLRSMLMIGVAAMVTLGAPASAHNEYRIIGTIEKLGAKSISVKQARDGKVITMEMDDASLVTRNKKKVAPSELKAGLYVVVDACGDSIDKLVVMEVRLVPPPARKGGASSLSVSQREAAEHRH